MNKKMIRWIAILLLALILIPMFLVSIEADAASAFYGDYTDVSYIYDYGACTGMQGLAVGSQMLYTVKINESDQLAVIKMTDKDTGETTTLYNADEGSYYFSYLDHANDMDVWGIDGYSNLFVATTRLDSYGIVRLQRDGSSLTRVANYKLVCDGETICATAMGVIGVSNGMINFITKWGQDIYTGSVSTSVTSGTIQMKHLCTISKEKVYIKGSYLDLTDYINQGMGYYDNMLYVPITGDDYNLEQSVIMVFNLDDVIEGSTIYPSEELVFRVTSSYYSALFEIESCGISSDGKLYFNQNRRVTTSDYNHDGVSYFDGYTYSALSEPSAYQHYTVQYNANGGTGSMSTTTVPYGVATALRKNSFTRAGYKFAGWTAYRTTNREWYYTNGSDSGWYTEGYQPSGYTKEIYDDQQQVSATSYIDGDVVIMYAQWEYTGASNYTVTFKNDDGTVLKSGTFSEGTIPTAPANPTKASDGVYNYTFAGWSPAITAVTGNTTYTATYKAELISVSPNLPTVNVPGTIAPYLERAYSLDDLQEGVPYVISDAYDNWLHYVLTAQPAQKVSGSLTHQGFLLNGLPSVEETNLWYIKGGKLVYGSANSNQYLLISCDASYTGLVELGSYNSDRATTIYHRTDDNFYIAGYNGYLNRHGGTENDFVATAYSTVGGSYWHFDRLVSGQVATMSIGASAATVSKGGTVQMTSSVWVDSITANNYTIDWSSNNNSVATVSSDGVVTGQSAGQVTITATLTAVDGHALSIPLTQTYIITVDAPQEHNYKVFVIEPTCTTGGYTTYRCTICGDSYQTNATPATGHNYRSAITKPTCTAQGYTTYTCTLCGANYKGTYTSATGHSYQSITVDATCTTAGYTTKTCSGCGDQQVTSISATGHSYKSVVTAATCTAGGYTTYTCANCGHSYQDSVTAAKGHSYANGKCTACGEADPNYVPTVTKPTLTLKAPTLEFKDIITVNAFYTAENIQDVVEMGMITYSTKVTSWSVATAENVIPGATYNESTGRYVSCSQGIHAKYLGDTVYLAIYAKLNDGTYAYSKLAGYSPVQYATSQLKGSDTKLKQLVVAMLNYGAEAQLYFGHNTSALANASLTAEQKALPAAYNSGMVSTVASAPAEKQGIFANNQGFAKRTPSISFEGAFCINYFFTPKYAPDSGITMYYWTAEDYNANSVLTTSNATGKIKLEGSGTGQYQGDIEGIAAKALSEAVYVACAYKSGGTVWTSGVLGYSIGSYCSSQASKGSSIAELAKATAVYGYQAKQYFG